MDTVDGVMLRGFKHRPGRGFADWVEGIEQRLTALEDKLEAFNRAAAMYDQAVGQRLDALENLLFKERYQAGVRHAHDASAD